MRPKDKIQHLRGVGDVFETILVGIGVKYLYTRVYGKKCNCGERRDKLNELIPFNPKINYHETYELLEDE
tara:strand:+ start:564 stop:773 length:210 start_codon:yes stop_codon:yes gene_type:complete